MLRAAVEAVEPRRLVASARALPALDGRPLFVIAAGKAVWPMASGLADVPGLGIEAGLLAGPRIGAGPLPARFEWIAGGHPRPDAASEAGGRRALALARQSRSGGALLVLLSGGASSLLAVPAPGLTLDDKGATIAALMDEGAGIADLNCVRKHLSAIKGGRLGATAGSAIALVISDVHTPIEDDPAVIGSGPVSPDGTTFTDALSILRRTGPLDRFPRAAVAYLERGARGGVEETPKPGDPRLTDVVYEILANRHTAVAGAARMARELGCEVHVIAEATRGEAREAGAAFARTALDTAGSSDAPRVCVIGSGETTVHVRGSGVGGRNQEFALAAVAVLDGSATGAGRPAVLASVGTDGIDGPTDAAGAVVDSSSAARARRAALDPGAACARNASYDFFEALGDLIKWGPTGTNVGDVHVALVARGQP